MSELTQQEQAVLDLIAANPFIGQSDIASALGLARSTVAAHIVQLGRKGRILGRGYVLPKGARIVTIGGAVLDRKYVAAAGIVPATSNPVASLTSFGGVARNVTENLARLDVAVSFVSLTGDDDHGRAIAGQLKSLGVDVSQLSQLADARTAEYVAVLEPDGALHLGLADMAVFDRLLPAVIERAGAHIAGADWIFADCNTPAETLSLLRRRALSGRYRLAVDAVSTFKVKRLGADLAGLDLIFLNLDEARALLSLIGGEVVVNAEEAARRLIAAGAGGVVLTQGEAGVIVADAHGLARVPSVPAHLVDATGAGDALIAGTLAGLVANPDMPLAEATRTGTLTAALTIESTSSVRPDLSVALIDAARDRLLPLPA
jgi:pseudouridine kinase